MKNSVMPVVVTLVLFAVGFSGCISSEGTGVLVLKITDAPADLNITKALVNISNVEVHLIATGWYSIVEEEQVFDLVELKNVKQILGNVTLPAGRYTQVRLHVTEALVTIDGVEHDLKIPSSDIKLISPFSINKNETTLLTLDFDVEESVFSTGSGKYMMKPSIKVIQE